jgi:hypothetical protein
MHVNTTSIEAFTRQKKGKNAAGTICTILYQELIDFVDNGYDFNKANK